MYVASAFNHLECCEILLKAGANVNLASTNSFTPLIIAAQNGHSKVLSLLLKHAAAKDAQCNNGATPMFRASLNNHLECCEILFKAGANVNLANNNGFTPLMAAACKGNENCVEWLVNRGGAHLNVVNHNNSSALMVATAVGHFNIVKFLKRKGALLGTCVTMSDGNNYTAADIARAQAAVNLDGAAVEKELTRVCIVCGLGAGRIAKCGECMSVYYCSKQHQREHWPNHRSVCAEATRKRERQEMRKEVQTMADEKEANKKETKKEEEKKAEGDKKTKTE